jgi:hypothetical protein
MGARMDSKQVKEDVDRLKAALIEVQTFLKDNLPETYEDPIDHGPVILSFDPNAIPYNVSNLSKALDFLVD